MALLDSGGSNPPPPACRPVGTEKRVECYRTLLDHVTAISQ